MTNPTPKYRVKFAGSYLPGYLQTEELPLTMRNVMVDIINRDGGIAYQNGATFRDLSLDMRVLSRLDSNHSGIEQLGDCLEQYREGMRICARADKNQALYLGDTAIGHYLVATFKGSTYTLNAPDHDAMNYRVDFSTSPYFLGPTVSGSKSISGNDTITLNMTDTRKTYPEIDIPTGITGITVSHATSGKSFTFAGSHANVVTVNCADLTVKDSAAANKVALITSGPDYGIYHVGSGSFQLSITGVTGSGTVAVRMAPRLER